VKFIKKGFMKQKGDLQTRVDRYLFMQRNMPHSVTGEKPADLICRASPRTHFNVMRPNLKNKVQMQQAKSKEHI
jgi:hypothetical protein